MIKKVVSYRRYFANSTIRSILIIYKRTISVLVRIDEWQKESFQGYDKITQSAAFISVLYVPVVTFSLSKGMMNGQHRTMGTMPKAVSAYRPSAIPLFIIMEAFASLKHLLHSFHVSP